MTVAFHISVRPHSHLITFLDATSFTSGMNRYLWGVEAEEVRDLHLEKLGYTGKAEVLHPLSCQTRREKKNTGINKHIRLCGSVFKIY